MNFKKITVITFAKSRLAELKTLPKVINFDFVSSFDFGSINDLGEGKKNRLKEENIDPDKVVEVKIIYKKEIKPRKEAFLAYKDEAEKILSELVG